MLIHTYTPSLQDPHAFQEPKPTTVGGAVRAGAGELDAVPVHAPAHASAGVALRGLVVALAVALGDVAA